MDKELQICGCTLKVREYKTTSSEYDRYGISVYIIFDVPCELWERLMPSGTIREKWRRDVNNLWGAFIYNNSSNLNSFISQLSYNSGYKIHLANRSTVPSSVYYHLTSRGLSWYGDGPDAGIKLIFYASNK